MVIDRDGAPRAGRTTAVACACLIAVAGCASTPAPQPTTNPPTAAPIFESDEEALAAATEAYANYQQMADLITADGGHNPERIAPFVSDEYLSTEVQQYAGYQDANAHSIGKTTFVVADAQRLDYMNRNDTSITLYICDDVSGIDVRNEADESLVTETRTEVTPFEVGFVLSEDDVLVVDSRDVWEQENFC
jgi:hypothetical protein